MFFFIEMSTSVVYRNKEIEWSRARTFYFSSAENHRLSIGLCVKIALSFDSSSFEHPYECK